VVGFSARVDVTGLENAQRIAQRVRNLGADTAPLLQIAGSILEASTVRRFSTESGPGGIPWPKSKRAKRDGGKTLTDTADLRDSIRYELRPGEVTIGSDGLKNPVKALANQFGSRRQTVVLAHMRTVNSAFGVPLPGGPRSVNVRAHGRITNLPARPFVGVDAQDRDDLSDAWLDYLRSLFHA
jgi:phage gpG-like protein